MRKTLSTTSAASPASASAPSAGLLGAFARRMRRPQRPTSESRIVDARMGDWTVISVIGAMDGTMLPDLHYFTDRAICLPTHVALDLQRVESFDISIAQMLVHLRKNAARTSRDIRIVGRGEIIGPALQTAGIADMFPIYDCLADAVTATREEGLDIQVYVSAEEAVICCRGRGDGSFVMEIEAAFRGVPSGVREVDIDFRAVSQADGAFLAAVRDFADYKRESGGRVRVAASQAVARAITLEGLGRAFEIISAPRRMSSAPTDPFAAARRR